MKYLLSASLGMALGGVAGSVAAAGLVGLGSLRRRMARPDPPRRLLLLIILVEVRVGRSVLAGLQTSAAALPEWVELGRAARRGTLVGLTAAVDGARGDLRRILSQLARAQRSGAPLADTVRGMIESDIAEEKARSLARARSLPVRLMVPMTLLVLPGLLLLLYAPALIRLIEDLASPF